MLRLLPRLAVVALLLQTTALAAAEAAPLLEDRYSGELTARRAVRGPWRIADGAAVCTQDDELYKKHQDHGPVIWYDVKFTDAAIHFTYKPDKLKTLVFTVNGPDGHVFRFVTSAAGTNVLAYPPTSDHKPKVLSRGGPKLREGEWTKVAVELRGPRAIVRIGDDYTVEVEDASIARPKTIVGLGFSFGTLTAKDFRIVPLPAK